MTENIEEKFNDDTCWVLGELKQEELANAYSEYKIKFDLLRPSDEAPELRSQRRILKMLVDRKAISASPFYHQMNILSSALEMQGALPIGYYISILQPQFDEIFEEYTKQTPSPSPSPPPDVYSKTEKGRGNYTVSLTKDRHIVLNNTLVLSSVNFNSENHNVIEYVLQHPSKKIDKSAIEASLNCKIKKSFHSILNDIGFTGELRKVFFSASKTSLEFRNNISETTLDALGIDKEKLAKELSGLTRYDKKQ